MDSQWIDVPNLANKVAMSTFQDYLSNPWVIDPLVKWSSDILYLIKSICQILLKELL